MKKAHTIAALAAAVAVVVGGCVPDESAERQQRQDTSAIDKAVNGDRPKADKPKPDKPEGRLETASEANARVTAEDYLEFAAFSRTGLIDQLKFEGFGTKAATYGVDATGADWNEQAALSAEDYLSGQSFSRAGLVDQLEFEGFTQAQAEYGVSVAYR